MLFTGNSHLLSCRVTGVIAIALAVFLLGCTSSLKKTTTQVTDETSPYGEWFLLNPQDMQENLITGGLIVCRKAIREKGNAICSDNGYTMMVLERNFGYGCTDYVSAGVLEFSESDQYWYLVSDSGPGGKTEKMKIQRNGEQLYVYQSTGKKLVFERSTRKAIGEKANLACELSNGQNGF